MTPAEVRGFVEAAASVAAGRDHEWKAHARATLARYRGATVEQVVEDGCVRASELARMVGIPPEQLAGETVAFNAALYEWGLHGFPHFSLAPDFFHAVAETDFGDPTDEPLYMPFHAFTLSFPPTAAFGGASKAFVYRLPRVLLVPLDGGRPPEVRISWALYRASLMTADPIFTQWDMGMTRRQLVDERLKLDSISNSPGTRPVEEHEIPMLARLRSLLANVMSYVEAAGPLPAQPRKKGAAPQPVELTHPQQAIFDVGRPVKLDARIRAALTGTGGDGQGWKVAQRFIVRGHWRNQAHGERRALRKRLWIEPHWKGPDNVLEAIERTYEVGHAVREASHD